MGQDQTAEQRIVEALVDGLDSGDPGVCHRFSVLALHQLLIQDRGITHTELALELDCSLAAVERYFRIGADAEPSRFNPRALTSERVDDAITAISERRLGRQYPRALRTAGPLLADGLPEVIELLDPEPLEYLQEVATRDLMKPDVLASRPMHANAPAGGQDV